MPKPLIKKEELFKIITISDEKEYMSELKKQGFSKIDEVRISEIRTELEGLIW